MGIVPNTEAHFLSFIRIWMVLVRRDLNPKGLKGVLCHSSD